jgi:hypothetical protein
MNRIEKTAFLAFALVLLLFLALFPALTIDAIGKLMSRQGVMDPGNFALIVFLEMCRAATTIVAVIAGLVLLIRFSDRPDGRALTLFVIFLALTHEKILGTIVYPGPLQEKFTLALLGAGVSRRTLVWIFGPLAWSIWPALAAIGRFSVVFPNPISPVTIDESAVDDRRGMLRGAGVAGIDIGAAFRRLSKWGLSIGAFEPVPIWSAAIVMVVITSVAGGSLAAWISAIGTLLVGSVAITNLRASYRVVAPADKERLRWLQRGFLMAGGLFLIAAVPLLVLNDPVTSTAALILLTLAPAVLMICMAIAVTTRSQ